MNTSKIEIDRIFLCSIDSAKAFVEYNEYTIDPDGEIFQYILQLFARNYDNTDAKKCFFKLDSFIASILPEDATGFDAFVDVIADEIHTLMQDAVDLPSGSGIFVWATVEEQPVIAFFKLNFQKRLACVVDDGTVEFKQRGHLLPTQTQKEYDYFYINIMEHKTWMTDMICHVDNESVNYMAEKILKISLVKSEKEAVKQLQDTVIDTIKECYKEEAPKKVFEYRQSVVDEAEDFGNITPKRIAEVVFADNEEAKAVYQEKLEEREIPKEKPVEVSNKTKRSLKKKQKIVTENGIEILVPIEFLEDKSIFDYKQDSQGGISILIKDAGGQLK